MIELPQPTNKSKIYKIHSEKTSYFVVAFFFANCGSCNFAIFNLVGLQEYYNISTVNENDYVISSELSVNMTTQAVVSVK